MKNLEDKAQYRTGNKSVSLDAAADKYFNDRSEEKLEAVILAAERFIRYFVRIYGNNAMQQDLIQAGNEGLLKALKRFDKGIGVSFSTYAGSLISGEIRHCIRKENDYYQPRTVEKLQRKIDNILSQQLEYNGEPPTIEELSHRINIREEGIMEVMRAGILSIDEVDVSKIVNIKAESFKLNIEDRIMMEQAVKKLSDLQKKVIKLLFYGDMTQEQVARRLGINQRKVSRLLTKSLEQLRNEIELN